MSATGESVSLVPSFNPMSVAPSPGGNGTTNVQIVAPAFPISVPKTPPKVETELQKAAFKEYLVLGPGRTLSQVAAIKRLHVKESILREWAETWDWPGRLKEIRRNQVKDENLEIVEMLLHDMKEPNPDKPGEFRLSEKASIDKVKKSSEVILNDLKADILESERKLAKLKAEIATLTGAPNREDGGLSGSRQMVIVNITGR